MKYIVNRGKNVKMSFKRNSSALHILRFNISVFRHYSVLCRPRANSQTVQFYLSVVKYHKSFFLPFHKTVHMIHALCLFQTHLSPTSQRQCGICSLSDSSLDFAVGFLKVHNGNGPQPHGLLCCFVKDHRLVATVDSILCMIVQTLC